MCAFACAGAGDVDWGDETWVRVLDREGWRGNDSFDFTRYGVASYGVAWHEMYSKTFERESGNGKDGTHFGGHFYPGVLWMEERRTG